MSGEAIPSAENSVKPLGGRGSASSPAGELTALPRPATGGRGCCPTPALGLRFCPDEKSWAHPCETNTMLRTNTVGHDVCVRRAMMYIQYDYVHYERRGADQHNYTDIHRYKHTHTYTPRPIYRYTALAVFSRNALYKSTLLTI